MSIVTRDNLDAIKRVRIEADRLTLACSAVCGAVPIALGVAFASSIEKLPPEIRRELERSKGVKQ